MQTRPGELACPRLKGGYLTGSLYQNNLLFQSAMLVDPAHLLLADSGLQGSDPACSKLQVRGQWHGLNRVSLGWVPRCCYRVQRIARPCRFSTVCRIDGRRCPICLDCDVTGGCGRPSGSPGNPLGCWCIDGRCRAPIGGHRSPVCCRGLIWSTCGQCGPL